MKRSSSALVGGPLAGGLPISQAAEGDQGAQTGQWLKASSPARPADADHHCLRGLRAAIEGLDRQPVKDAVARWSRHSYVSPACEYRWRGPRIRSVVRTADEVIVAVVLSRR